MNIKELAKKIGYGACTIRMYLCRPEFSDLRINKGNIENLEERHIKKLVDIIENRIYGVRYRR